MKWCGHSNESYISVHAFPLVSVVRVCDSEILKCDHSKVKYTEQIVPVLCLFIML